MWRINESQTLILKIVKKSSQIVYIERVLHAIFIGINKVENFKYITIRNVIIRVIYAILVFLLVKSPEHYLLYFSLTVAVVLLNAAINLIYARNFVKFSFKVIRIRKNCHLLSLCIIHFLFLITVFYVDFFGGEPLWFPSHFPFAYSC